ncbi:MULTISPECIES: DegT/DnrJ/EryC1/StrS family aminotransferase [Pseudomonas]|uniref:dTDP-4-amino-4,6-dideoxy-D-glucose transaminase n=1 Tax=Pseudomonas fluorescens TaxID=294 RepID=A0A5E6Z2R7_PSEFL|nr:MULTISPECIES: DegT/DnrJ/EryC1/StrS family aminotransferase [Pseudomonas]PAA12674.1 aminotransferase [Pseudomonas fragi]VVN60668.1 dTDP-4-amino-4,6-dideoxy-D-glucose transaminase [Pseudomonas fluorescens]
MNSKPIYVTQPSLPLLSEFNVYLEKIWGNKILTNCGEMHQALERELCKYLGVEYISLFNNGTIALLTALQALDVKGEVITTPYSFVATAHSLLWNGITPVFVDIDSVSMNMNPDNIEAAITPATTAIMPVHCYGNACDVVAIDKIAKKHDLKVIYDAAHAFAVNDHEGGSLLNHGDLSVLSFHATKVFNTFEGGAIVCRSAAMKKKIDQLKNFGFVDEVTVVAPGINGKMSEVNAAFGLLQLKSIDAVLGRRKEVSEYYRAELASIPGVKLAGDHYFKHSNNSYFPIIVTPEFPISRDGLYEQFKEANIFSRRYFFPLISDFPMYKNLESSADSNLPVAKRTAEQVLCLPIHAEMTGDDLLRVVAVIKACSLMRG